MNQRIASIAILVAGSALGAAILWMDPFAKPAEAQGVEIREGGVLVSSGSEEEALAAASESVGFEVRTPAYVPPGLELEFVDTALGPEGVPNALKIAALSYGPIEEADHGLVQVRIEQPGIRFSPPDARAEVIDSGLSGVDVYRQVTGAVRGYWLFTPDLGFLLMVTGAQAPGDDEIMKMLKSLVP